MSIVLLGIDMPNNCEECEIYFCDKWIGHYENTRPKDCPLRPMPDVHGDLIDRDATRGSIKPWSPEDERNACTFATVKKLLNTMLDHAPTIVEAEGD